MSSARFRDAIEEQLKLSPNPNLHFLWIDAPGYLTPQARNELTLRVRYLFWQRAVLREARRQHRLEQFDLVHHLSWGTISAPPLLWRLPIPLVWGPVGGAQTAPRAYRRYFGPAWRDELLRTLRVNLVTRMPGLRRTVRNCALILSTNPETTRALQTAGAREVRFHPNIGITEESLVPTVPSARAESGPVILWAGRLIPIKGLPLALEAFAQLDTNLRARLRIAGDGPIRAEMESLAQALGIAERVDFLGAVPWLEMNRQYHEADLFLFTSLRDSSGQVLAEAMASGLPIVALNHHGTGAIVPPAAGIRVSVENPDRTVRALTEAMHGLISSPESREGMGQAGRLHAQSMSWKAHAEIMSHWYTQVLAGRQLNDEYAYAAV
jgi:glycosyltransferase involved in cell wall biosynthesis